MTSNQRRQTIVEPDQITGAHSCDESNRRRMTIIEDDSPQQRSSLISAEAVPETLPGVAPTTRFCPQMRPPAAKLFILDDSGIDAEVVRVRTDRFRIGREVGDVVVNHDGQMSGEHAEIRREFANGEWKWFVVDLQSTNGLFVRVTEVPLEDGLEVWLGGRLYCFEDGVSRRTPHDTIMPTRDSGTMIAASRNPVSGSAAALVEVTADGSGAQYALSEAGYWIGRDPNQCQIVIDDPMLGSKDTYAFLDNEQKWGLRKGKSLNGIWVKVGAVPVIGQCLQFQCGEQRFALRID